MWDVTLSYCHNDEVIFRWCPVVGKDTAITQTPKFDFPPREHVVESLLLFGFKMYQYQWARDTDILKIIKNAEDDDPSRTLEVFYEHYYVGDIVTESL